MNYYDQLNELNSQLLAELTEQSRIDSQDCDYIYEEEKEEDEDGKTQKEAKNFQNSKKR